MLSVWEAAFRLRQDEMRARLLAVLLPWQTRVIEELTGMPLNHVGLAAPPWGEGEHPFKKGGPVSAGTGLFRPHSHCPVCWGEKSAERSGTKVCAECDVEPRPEMLVCTPAVCASS